MDKNTNCDPCEAQGNRTEGKSWCPNCEEKLCNGCASQEAQLPVTRCQGDETNRTLSGQS